MSGPAAVGCNARACQEWLDVEDGTLEAVEREGWFVSVDVPTNQLRYYCPDCPKPADAHHVRAIVDDDDEEE